MASRKYAIDKIADAVNNVGKYRSQLKLNTEYGIMSPREARKLLDERKLFVHGVVYAYYEAEKLDDKDYIRFTDQIGRVNIF